MSDGNMLMFRGLVKYHYSYSKAATAAEVLLPIAELMAIPKNLIIYWNHGASRTGSRLAPPTHAP